jgi:hypothetical protein
VLGEVHRGEEEKGAGDRADASLPQKKSGRDDEVCEVCSNLLSYMNCDMRRDVGSPGTLTSRKSQLESRADTNPEKKESGFGMPSRFLLDFYQSWKYLRCYIFYF